MAGLKWYLYSIFRLWLVTPDHGKCHGSESVVKHRRHYYQRSLSSAVCCYAECWWCRLVTLKKPCSVQFPPSLESVIMRITTLTSCVLTCSLLATSSSLLYMQPYSLRNLFYREEAVIQMLQNIQKFYKSQRLEEYLNSCAPRLQELALLHNLMDEVRTQNRNVQLLVEF